MVYFIVCVNSGTLHFKIILRPFHGNHVLTFKHLPEKDKFVGQRSEVKRSEKRITKKLKNIVIHLFFKIILRPFNEHYVLTFLLHFLYKTINNKLYFRLQKIFNLTQLTNSALAQSVRRPTVVQATPGSITLVPVIPHNLRLGRLFWNKRTDGQLTNCGEGQKRSVI